MFSVHSYGQEVVRLSTCEWPPFLSRTLKNNGLYAHIVQIAFEEMGIKVEYIFQPCKRAIHSAEYGISNIDGVIAISENPQRKERFHFSDSIHEDCNVFFYLKKTNFHWEKESDLEGFTVGAPIGYYCLTKLENLKKEGINLQIESPVQDKQLFQMLVFNRIQIASCSKTVGQYLIQNNFSHEIAETIVSHPKPFYCKSYHAIFPRNNKKSKRLVDIFNKGLEIIHENGKYKRLIENLPES